VQLGVQYRSLTPEIAEAEALSVAEGALVEEVLADTPAEDAGLQVGDIITAVDGDIVDIEHTLSDRLYAYEPEDRVTLTVLRGEETLEIGVVLAEGQHPFMPYLGDVVEGFIPFEMPGMPGRDIIFEGIPFNSDNFPSPRIRIFSEAFPGGDSIMPFSGQIQISTEPPAEIVEGMVVYECTRGNQVWYLSIAGEMKKMMENRPNMPMMGNCEIYASGDSSSTENNLNS
jgi:membrane-associated protease RseP (regulator of RpoE activity)